MRGIKRIQLFLKKLRFDLAGQNNENIGVSIVIVTYNNEEDIAECLNSIYKSESKVRLETILVDNNSTDKTLKIVKSFLNIFREKIVIIENKENLGFSAACNQGFKISSGKTILLLNPDTEILHNSIELLFNKLLESNYAAIAPQIRYKNGNIQYSCRYLPSYNDLFLKIFLISVIFSKNRVLAKWQMKYFSHDEEMEVEQPMAAAFLIKKTVLQEIEFIDERYFMFFNDVDLCRKIRDKNLKILFYPEVRIMHKKGSSVFQERAKMIKIWNSDCLKYFKKHNYKKFRYYALKVLLIINGNIRILLKL